MTKGGRSEDVLVAVVLMKALQKRIEAAGMGEWICEADFAEC